MSRQGAGLFAVSGIGLLSYFYCEKNKLQQERQNKQNEGYGKPKVGGPFRLVDHFGTIVTEKTFSGTYTLIYFGYTVQSVLTQVLS
jgi:protein SCO1/2